MRYRGKNESTRAGLGEQVDSPEDHRPIPAELIAEAKKHPGGWVYEIDGVFAPTERVPPESIRGAWSVDANGDITGDFVENPRFKSRHKP